jgi:hemerythrin superfamily protein
MKIVRSTANFLTKQNTGEKYSDLLSQIYEEFRFQFPIELDLGEVFQIIADVWNLSNFTESDTEGVFQEMRQIANSNNSLEGLITEMIRFKKEKFAEHDRFIADFLLDHDGSEGQVVLTVSTCEKEHFLNTMDVYSMENESDITEFGPGYVNRSALVLVAKEPLYAWLNELFPGEDLRKTVEPSVYLITEPDTKFDSWLRKKFDKFFREELELWELDKKKWPQRRNFKMFNEWFELHYSPDVFDWESEPVRKTI